MVRFPGCECYWLEATDRVQVSLRRYANIDGDGKCPATGWDIHDASVVIGTAKWKTRRLSDNVVVQASERMRARTHKSWPKTCACGYTFVDDDHWQTNGSRLYERADGTRVPIRGWSKPGELDGALYDSWWMHQLKSEDGRGYVGADGLALTAVCPNGGHWNIDGPASTGGRWTRTGDPRQPATLTVSPSIAFGIQTRPDAYHGFLQAGRFTDDLGS